MSTSSATSSTHALRRASMPPPETAKQDDSPATVEKPPLELKRVPKYEISQGRDLWGSPDYQGTSLSVSAIGPIGLAVLSSFLTVDEIGKLAEEVPEVQTTPTVSNVVVSMGQIDAALRDGAAALGQSARVDNAVNDADRGLGCYVIAGVTLLAGGSFTTALGEVAMLAGLSAGVGHVVVTVGRTVAGVGCLPLLRVGFACVKNACDRRSANRAVNAAQMDLERGHRALSTDVARVRVVDLPSLEMREGLLNG